MALKYHSVFYYGHKVDENNNIIDFADSPGGTELFAEIPVGSYTLTKYLEVFIGALNAASSLTWSASVDRITRIVTIESSAPADLLFGTGVNNTTSPASLLGFDQADMTNQTTFVGSFGSGFEWRPKFPLQDYKGKDKNKKLVNAVVNKSASGDNVSVQSFGVDRFIKMNAKWITNRSTDGILRPGETAVEEAIAFMDYAVEKHPMEFMENEDLRDTFDKVYLESTGQGGDGTMYELMEYVGQNLPEYFETGILTFKVINLE